MNPLARKLLFFAAGAFCLAAPFVSSAMALSLGLIFGIFVVHPFPAQSKQWTPKLLSYAVIGLGASMNLEIALRVGLSGFVYTALGITLTLMLGLALGRIFQQNDRVAVLLSVGTAICGGSAIASVAPVVRARQEEISLALGIVFLLNAIALFLFPPIGHALHMTQEQFGVWAALAIHDTSSVVGATLAYGDRALQIGTTVKLARALWIVPVTLATAALWTRFARGQESGGEAGPRKYPWFILGFLCMAAIYTWVPALSQVCYGLAFLAKRLMVLTLFLIGANINVRLLRSMGLKPAMHAVALWAIVACTALLGILLGFIPTTY